MNTYTGYIDGGEGGTDTFEADTANEALVDAIAWARDGDWGDGGCNVTVSVINDDDPDDEAREEIYIPTTAEAQDEKLAEDGEVLANDQGEWSTEQIIRIGDDLFYAHPNGGARGAWNRQDGDGIWRERPVEPTREISPTDAKRLMLDWGYDPKEISRIIR